MVARINNFFKNRNRTIALIALAVVIVVVACVSVAFLHNESNGIVNTFKSTKISVKVDEEYDGETKSNVNVTNTSNVYAYVRIQLVSYRVVDDGKGNLNRIGGSAPLSFVPGEGWIDLGKGCYAYSVPVAPGSSPKTPLIDSIKLIDYSKIEADDIGGKQVLDVVAEAIQSDPTNAVVEAWDVKLEDNAIVGLKTN